MFAAMYESVCRVLLCLCLLMDMNEKTKEQEGSLLLILMVYMALSFETAQRWRRLKGFKHTKRRKAAITSG